MTFLESLRLLVSAITQRNADESQKSGSQHKLAVIKRVLKGISANSFAYGSTILVQLVSVPLLVSKWGVESYGTWVVIISLATYLALFDLGFPTVAGNAMAAAVANGNTREALAIFQSIWRFVNCASLALVLTAAFALYIGHGEPWAVPVTLIALTSAFQLCCSCFQSGFRAAGFYATGVFLQSLNRLASEAVVLITVWLGGGWTAAALGYLLVAALAATWMPRLLLQKVPWLRIGWGETSWRHISLLMSAALSTLMTPISFALTLQGVPILLAFMISTQAVAVFSVARTITRLGLQATAILTHSVTPEYASFPIGSSAMRKLFVANFGIVFLFGAVFLILTVTFGGKIASLWTNGKIIPGHDLLAILGFAALFQMFNNVLFNVLLGINKHHSSSLVMLMAALATICSAAALVGNWGTDGAGYALLGPEILLSIYMWSRLRNLGVTAPELNA